MTGPRGPGQRFSLARWSRRKLQAAKAAPPTLPASAAPGAAPAAPVAVELPPVESLTLGSDFTAFLRPEVDDQLKRAALKQLFRDPRFNLMDGLDTYVDDYTQADPIAPDVLADLLRRGFGAVQEAGAGPVAQVPAAAAGTGPEATPPALTSAAAPPLPPAPPAPPVPSVPNANAAGPDAAGSEVAPDSARPADAKP